MIRKLVIFSSFVINRKSNVICEVYNSDSRDAEDSAVFFFK